MLHIINRSHHCVKRGNKGVDMEDCIIMQNSRFYGCLIRCLDFNSKVTDIIHTFFLWALGSRWATCSSRAALISYKTGQNAAMLRFGKNTDTEK